MKVNNHLPYNRIIITLIAISSVFTFVMSYKYYGLVKTEHLIFILLITFLLIALIYVKPQKISHLKKKLKNTPIPKEWIIILNDQVPYYQKLSNKEKLDFEKKIQLYLNIVKITGIGTSVSLEDKIRIASGGVMPIFKLKWFYTNLHEILLYPQAFDEDYHSEGDPDSERILGMVGNRSMENVMILSQEAVSQAYDGSPNKQSNVIIHESAHLIDKVDGITDGVPELCLTKDEDRKEWIEIASKTISLIREGKAKDIDSYAGTDISEFFAVLSEYFFTSPAELRAHHPELYKLYCKMYNQTPA